MRIFITGLPKTGKTTLGKELAKCLNHVYIDSVSTLSAFMNHADPFPWVDRDQLKQTLTNGGVVTMAEIQQLVWEYTQSDFIDYHGFVMEVDERGLSSELKTQWTSWIQTHVSDCLLVHLEMEKEDFKQRMDQLWLDPWTHLTYLNEEVVYSRSKLKKREDDVEEKDDLEIQGKGDGLEGGEDVLKEDIEDTLNDRSLVDLPDEPVSNVISRPYNPTLIEESILRRLLPFQTPTYLDLQVPPTFLASIVPNHFQLHLDATCHYQYHVQSIRAYLQLQRMDHPTLRPLALSEETLGQLLAFRLDELDVPYSLGTLDAFCPVTLHEQKVLTEGSCQFAAGYKSFIYLLASADHQKRFLAHPRKYLNPKTYRSSFKVCLVEPLPWPHVSLTDLLVKYYDLPLLSLTDYLQQQFQAPHVKDAWLNQALPWLRSGQPIPEDFLRPSIHDWLHSALNSHRGYILLGFPLNYLTSLGEGLTPEVVIAPPDVSLSFTHPCHIIQVATHEGFHAVFHKVRQVLDPTMKKAETGTPNMEIEVGCTLDYCPVTLLEKKMLKKGTNQHTATFMGKQYQFASQTELSEFLQDPIKYIQTIQVPPPRFCFLGPTGAGVSTVSATLEKKYNLITVNASEFLRDLRKKDKEWEDVDSEAPLAPKFLDKLMHALMYEEPYASQGFILKGFPRTVDETNHWLSQGWCVDAFVFFKAEPSFLMDRLMPMYLKDNPHLDALKEEQGEEDNPIELLRQDVLANIEKEVSHLNEIFQEISQTNIFELEVDASKCIRAVSFTVSQKLASFLDYRSDLFRKALALSNERAETLLKHGFKSYSEFGRICPVTLEKKGLISESTLGKFPVVLENHVYWLKSKKKLHEFKLNPSCYLKTTHLLPYVPSVVLMTGPPLSGKTTLGKSLAMDLGVPYFHFPTLLVSIIQESSVFFSTLRSHLQSGGELSAAMASKTIDWVIKRSPAGCVLDDIVTDIDRVPDLVIQSDFTFPELLSRAHASSWGEYLVKQKLEVYEGHWIPLLNTWQKHFDQVIKLPTHLSKWHQKFEMTRDVFLRLSKIRAFQYAKSQQLPFSAYQVGLHKENVIHQKSLDYCPVSLKFGFRDLSPTSWKFSCFYKDVVYHCCSSEHQSLFLKDPSYYLDQDYPTEIPQLVSAEKVADSFPEKVEFKGYCPVTLRDEKKCVDGSKNCALRFSGKLFFMSDEDAKMKFIRNPEAYATFISTMKLPVRQPAIPLSLLPPSDYLLRTLSALLIQIFHQLGKFRPILPFQSPTQSAVSYIALSLNAQNPRFSDHRRKYWTQLLHRYSDDAEILTFLTREIQKQNGEYGNPSSFNSTFKKKLNEFFSQSRLQR